MLSILSININPLLMWWCLIHEKKFCFPWYFAAWHYSNWLCTVRSSNLNDDFCCFFAPNTLLSLLTLWTLWQGTNSHLKTKITNNTMFITYFRNSFYKTFYSGLRYIHFAFRAWFTNKIPALQNAIWNYWHKYFRIVFIQP